MTRITSKSMGLTMIFPRVVGLVHGIEISQDHIDLLMREHLSKNIANKISTNTYLLEMPELRGLKDVIEECMAHYVEQVIKPADKVKFKITQSWLNVASKGEQHHYHAHPNSYLSGCLYISADKDVDSIQFFRENRPEIQIEHKEFDIVNSDSWSFPVGTGDMIFFSSRLPHAVPPNSREEKRVSLAFNAFVEGTLGKPDFYSELQINITGGKYDSQ